MIEATKAPACPHVYEVEARYGKIVPKGQRGCVHELTVDIDVLIEENTRGLGRPVSKWRA